VINRIKKLPNLIKIFIGLMAIGFYMDMAEKNITIVDIIKGLLNKMDHNSSLLFFLLFLAILYQILWGDSFLGKLKYYLQKIISIFKFK
tara:strand:+ start:523 stop:789 length:267 start_codon:yes stop_codon:yes gene_type:complete